MNVIETIKLKLQKYPSLRYECGDNSITVFPPSSVGFEISVFMLEGEIKVHFEGWYERFDDAESALNYFAFGLSEECRLRVTYRGNQAYKWTVESKQEGQWVADGTVGLMFFPFWRKKSARYFQNSILPA